MTAGNHQDRTRLTHQASVQADDVTNPDPGDRPRYEIRVRGRLGQMMLSAFPSLQAQVSGNDTVLTGVLPDQAALFGVLANIEALGLELLDVSRLDRTDEDPLDRDKSS